MTSESRPVVDEALVALRLSCEMKTDPAVIRDILSATKVDDRQTTCPSIREFLERLVSHFLGDSGPRSTVRCC